MSDQFRRREFLRSTVAASAVAASTGMVAAGYTATARGFAANETLRIGCIDTGANMPLT